MVITNSAVPLNLRLVFPTLLDFSIGKFTRDLKLHVSMVTLLVACLHNIYSSLILDENAPRLSSESMC
jgi:hypothetical protein